MHGFLGRRSSGAFALHVYVLSLQVRTVKSETMEYSYYGNPRLSQGCTISTGCDGNASWLDLPMSVALQQ